MFLYILLTSSVLGFARPAVSPRPCTRLSVIEVDTTVDVTTTGASRLLHQRSFDGPRYPIDLRNQRVQGDVRASFVVDTLGRVVRESSGILEESHPAFGQSVCEFLRNAAFEPVVVEGKRVSVRVVGMRFQFKTRGD